ncbi:GNAT family N-acetyltransferase [Streptomyces sp. NPDC020597]|uniref:GNAT family N-acetyltransferase n=1 Tax=unclassified Streptomyces TaxID=2593676 RepID=UPI0037A2AD85
MRFHESRSLSVHPVETTFVIAVSARVVGAARLYPVEGQDGTVEAGVWIGRSHRGAGVGAAVLQLLLEQARPIGWDQVYVSTTPQSSAVRALMDGFGVDRVPDGEELVGRGRFTS